MSPHHYVGYAHKYEKGVKIIDRIKRTSLVYKHVFTPQKGKLHTLLGPMF